MSDQFMEDYRRDTVEGLVAEIDRLKALVYGPTGHTYKAHCAELHARVLSLESELACLHQQQRKTT